MLRIVFEIPNNLKGGQELFCAYQKKYKFKSQEALMTSQFQCKMMCDIYTVIIFIYVKQNVPKLKIKRVKVIYLGYYSIFKIFPVSKRASICAIKQLHCFYLYFSDICVFRLPETGGHGRAGCLS